MSQQKEQLSQVSRAVIEMGRQLRIAALVGAGACLASQAMAADESTAPEKAASEASSSGQQLDRVVVTARKKSELIQDVPVSITAISSNDLIQQNTPSVTEYFRKIPGLSLAASTNGKSELVLRGVTTGPNANPTVGFTIDDSPFGASTYNGNGAGMVPDIDPADLQRVEVLRGPQGTLYGATSLGGLVKYVTVVPDTHALSGRVQIDGASAAHGSTGYGVRASVNVPVIEDRLAFRVSAFDRQDPGVVDDLTQNKKNIDETKVRGGRISAVLYPMSDVTIRASALTQKLSAEGGSSEDWDANNQPLNGGYAHRRVPGTDSYERKVNFYDLSVDADLKWARLTSTTARGTVDYNGPTDLSGQLGGLLRAVVSPTITGVRLGAPTNNTKFSQEIRLESPDESRTLDWRVGLFYTKEENSSGQDLIPVDINTGATLTGLPEIFTGRYSDSFKETAVFGTATYHVTDKFDVQAGLRRSRNKLTYTTEEAGIPILSSNSSVQASTSESATTCLLTPRYKLSKDLMAYATLSSGYRPGGVNPSFVSGGPETYKSDKTQNLELGLKGTTAQGTLSYNLSLYHIRWKDIQIFASDPVTSIGYFVNTSGAKSQGLEAELSWAAARGLTITGNFVAARAVLTSDLPEGTIGVAGDRLPYSPKFTASLSANQEFYLENGLRWNIGGSVAYVGDRAMRFESSVDDPRQLAPSYTTVDLNAGLRGKDWGLTAFIKNLGDRRGIMNIATPGPASASAVIVQRPRTIGLSAYKTFEVERLDLGPGRASALDRFSIWMDDMISTNTRALRAALLTLALSAAAVAHAGTEFISMGGGKFPFSPAVRVGNTLYLSGQLGIGANAKPKEFEDEARQAMENIGAVLKQAGLSMDDVFKCTVMLADMANWPMFNRVYATYFKPGRYPARSAMGVNGLALNAGVEVECIAQYPEKQ